MFSFPVEVNNSLRRRLRGFGAAGGEEVLVVLVDSVVAFSRPGFMRAVRFVIAVVV